LNDFGSNCLGDRSDLADEVGLAMAVLEAEDKTGSARAQNARPAIVIPFRVKGPLRKGLVGTPAGPQTIEPHARDALLQAIARSRRWIEAILKGEAATFEATGANVANREDDRQARFQWQRAFAGYDEAFGVGFYANPATTRRWDPRR
jgi:hypothetical protein